MKPLLLLLFLEFFPLQTTEAAASECSHLHSTISTYLEWSHQIHSLFGPNTKLRVDSQKSGELKLDYTPSGPTEAISSEMALQRFAQLSSSFICSQLRLGRRELKQVRLVEDLTKWSEEVKLALEKELSDPKMRSAGFFVGEKQYSRILHEGKLYLKNLSELIAVLEQMVITIDTQFRKLEWSTSDGSYLAQAKRPIGDFERGIGTQLLQIYIIHQNNPRFPINAKITFLDARGELQIEAPILATEQDARQDYRVKKSETAKILFTEMILRSLEAQIEFATAYRNRLYDLVFKASQYTKDAIQPKPKEPSINDTYETLMPLLVEIQYSFQDIGRTQ